MKRVYYHYTLWEDFQSGMYNEVKEGREQRIADAKKLLTTDDICYKYMKQVTTEWVHSCEYTFTNHFNHQAFLGQCACFLYAGCRDNETRMAWGLLTNEQRYNANSIADRVYYEWLEQYEGVVKHNQISIFDILGENL